MREIQGWSEITHLPKQPEYVRGVLNLRGAIVPIIDLRCRFGQGRIEATPLHIIIIVQIAARQVGLLADRVLDFVTFGENSTRGSISALARGARKYGATIGLAGRLGLTTIAEGVETSDHLQYVVLK